MKQISSPMLFRPSSSAVLETSSDTRVLTGMLCHWSRNSPGAAVPSAASATRDESKDRGCHCLCRNGK